MVAIGTEERASKEFVLAFVLWKALRTARPKRQAQGSMPFIIEIADAS